MSPRQSSITISRNGIITSVAAFVALILVISVGWTAVDQRDACFKMRYGRIVDRNIESGLTPQWWVYDIECLPMTDQQIPHGEGEGSDDQGWISVPFQTSDRVQLSVPVRAVVAYDPATVEEVFVAKKTQQAILGEIRSGIVSGAAFAGNSMSMDEIFDGGLEDLARRFQGAMQEEVGRLAEVKQVYIRTPDMPAAIREARANAREREEQIQQAQQQLQIDSVNTANEAIQARNQAVATRERAQAYADSVQLTMEAEAAAFARNASLAELRATEASARALAQLLAGCTQNCVVGGNVLDGVLAALRNGGR